MSESVRHPTSFLLSKNIAHCVRTHSTVKSHVRYNKTIFYYGKVCMLRRKEHNALRGMHRLSYLFERQLTSMC
ncbi:hypothetical protein Naga_100022g2 [Nannochloropsis gaditana]|uniref:Uncharacterized protein n=1 Tax=Nannochloropsis gaditana TaxID=72520 RepID=W7TR76_9STRA|nr:hypothetical protein Naga_100022g2 [Nannochloropsis gaditana]